MSLHTTPRGVAWPLARPGMAVPRLSDGGRAFLSSRDGRRDRDIQGVRARDVRPLFLHGPRHRRYVVLDEEGIEHHQRQRSDQRPGHQRAPAIDVAVNELVDDRDWHRLVLGRGDEGERVDELVPAQREAEDEGRDQSWYSQRQDDLGENLPAAGADDPRAPLELERDGLEIAHQETSRKRDQYGGIGEDQRERRVEQA